MVILLSSVTDADAQDAKWFTPFCADWSLAAVAAADVDGDGDLDLAFTGSGFVIRFVSRTEQILSPILAFSDSARALIPQTADFPAAGWYQGAAGVVGAGRVAVFGEAAMFTAQITGDGRIFGMRQPGAEQNPRFVLNLVRWLVGLIPEE